MVDGDKHISHKTYAVIQGHKYELVPHETMHEIERCRKSNITRKIIAFLSIALLILIIISTYGLLFFLAYFIVQIWKWQRSSHQHIYKETKTIRNADFEYDIYDKSILSEDFDYISQQS